VPKLEILAATGKVTPKVVIDYGSTVTDTLGGVIVAGVNAVDSGSAPSFEVVLEYRSIQST
jgi:hypothetical protein